MPVHYEVDPLRPLVRIEYIGPMILDEIFWVVDRLITDPRVRPGVNLLSDHSQATTSVTPQLVHTILSRFEQLADRIGSFRCALVSPRDAQFAIGNFMSVRAPLHAGVQLRPFRTREEAEAWLAQDEHGVGT